MSSTNPRLKRPNQTSEPPNTKKPKYLEPPVYSRLTRKVLLETPQGSQAVTALFDTGSNVFVLDQAWADHHSVFRVERNTQLNISGFAGKKEESAGRAFTPHLQLTINDHTTSVSCELASLEPGINLIIPGGWVLVQHPMTFDKEGIQVKEHECSNPSGIIYDESIIYDPDARIIRSISFGEPHTEDSLKEHIPSEYHQFIHLFTDEKGASLPPHRTVDYAIDLEEGKTAPFGPIYSLSEKELGVLREYLDRMLAQGKIVPPKSPAGSPILFVPKPNVKLRLCVDY